MERKEVFELCKVTPLYLQTMAMLHLLRTPFFNAAPLLSKDSSPQGTAGAFKTLLKHCRCQKRFAVEIQPLSKRKTI